MRQFKWNNAAEESFQRVQKELSEAPVLGMPTEKGMYVLDTGASVVAIYIRNGNGTGEQS